MSTDLQTPLISPAGRELIKPRFSAHFRIMRLDHSIKQAFIVPGILLGLALSGRQIDAHLLATFCVGLIAATFISSSNYVLNEVLDAPWDRMHPIKKARPAACGQVHSFWAYAQWMALMVFGLALSCTISRGFALSVLALWGMGCLYNIPPIRTKDVPYLDVLSESINNPIRFCIGWYMVTSQILPPVSVLVSYWMVGAYFMALKRFSEYRQIDNCEIAGAYRRSFRFYTQQSLLTSVLFYASAAMLFFGAFIMRYRIELILIFPLVAWLMTAYFDLSFRHESAVQNPEKLYREPRLMFPLALFVVAFAALLFVDLPWLSDIFPKSRF